MTPDEVRKKIGKIIEERGIPLAKLSVEIGKNVAYLHQFLSKGSPIRLPEEQRQRLAHILQVSEQELTDIKITPASTSEIDEAFLTRIIQNITDWEEKNGEFYSAEDKAKLIKLIYQKLSQSTSSDINKEISNVIDIYNYMKTAN